MGTSRLRILGLAFFAIGSFLVCSPAGAENTVRVEGDAPPAIVGLHRFRGTIDYVARKDAAGAPVVHGEVFVGDGRWSLDERGPGYVLHADADQASFTDGQGAASIDDLLESDALANAWAEVLASFASQSIAPSNGSEWTSGSGVVAYVNASGDQLLGAADSRGRNHIGFVFEDFSRSGPLALPHRVLRLRHGEPDGAFAVWNYTVEPAQTGATGRKAAHNSVADAGLRRNGSTIVLGAASSYAASPLRMQLAVLVSALLLAVFCVAWTRRDALVLALCKRIARDPRGWKRAGVSVFVAPDGALIFDGMKYRVGPHFYNRAALVQTSTLFLRVSAPAVAHVVILPRRFRPIDLGIRVRAAGRQTGGFTLIETLLATALFAAVVLFGIYPALVALLKADAMAQQRSLAVVIASNALADEQAANAYGARASTGSTITSIDGLVLTVTVTAGASHAVSDVEIAVADAGGNTLARVVSLLGPPVKAPPQSQGSPPP